MTNIINYLSAGSILACVVALCKLIVQLRNLRSLMRQKTFIIGVAQNTPTPQALLQLPMFSGVRGWRRATSSGLSVVVYVGRLSFLLSHCDIVAFDVDSDTRVMTSNDDRWSAIVETAKACAISAHKTLDSIQAVGHGSDVNYVRQTDYPVGSPIRRAGCYFLSILYICSYCGTVEEVQSVYEHCIRSGWMRSNCYVLRPDLIVLYLTHMAVGTVYSARNPGRTCIAQLEVQSGDHFVVVDRDDIIVYDPMDEAKAGQKAVGIKSYRDLLPGAGGSDE